MSSKLHELTYKEILSGHKLAQPIEVNADKGETVIVFSDSHIQKKFDNQQVEQLIKIISKGDIVIINGDLWWDSRITFDEFVNGKWNSLLDVLKSKQTYYLFGNHDMPILSDERIYQFCKQAGFKIKLTSGNETFNIEHGHLLSSKMITLILILFEKHPTALRVVTYPFGILHELTRLLFVKRGVKLMSGVNDAHKKKTNGEWLVVGHTHSPEVDYDKKYINLGFTHKGFFSYLEIVDGEFTLHQEKK